MSTHAHEPREDFVNQLEGRLRADLRRQRLETNTRTWSWWPQSRLAAALAMIVVMVASMALGGGVVAATYEARLSGQREVLVTTFEQRQTIAQQRLALTKQQLQEMERRISVGLEQKETLLDLQAHVSEAEAEVKLIELDLAEIRATGREPMHTISAPLVSGRDLVTERLRTEATVPTAALALETRRKSGVQSRVDVGLANPIEVEAIVSRIGELEAVVAAFDQKLNIRQTFLKGGLPAQAANLRALEADAQSRRTALTRRIESARKQVQALQSKVDVGTANPIEAAEARLRLQELELETTKVDYDLLLIRSRLGKAREEQ